MGIPSNASIELELGTPNAVAAAALTDSGDRKKFTFGGNPLSRQTGNKPVTMLAGLKSGGDCAGNTTNNEIEYTAIVCIHGSNASSDPNTGQVSISAGSVTCTRATGVNVIINSICVKNDGTVNAVVGTEAASFSDTRGAAGGAPLIPVDSFEIAQVRLTGSTAAVIASSEIFQSPGTHQELANSPIPTLDLFLGTVTFNAALPNTHVGPTTREVYGKYATPNFALASRSSNFKAAERSASANSQAIYGNQTIAGRTVNQNTGSFDLFLEDGITDAELKIEGDERWIRFKPDADETPYRLEIGYCSIDRDFTPTEEISAAVTFVPVQYGQDFDS